MPNRSIINIIASFPFGVLGGISGLIGSVPIGLTLGLFTGIYSGLNANFDYFGVFFGILFSPIAASIGALIYTPLSIAGWGVECFSHGFSSHFNAASYVINSIEKGVSYLTYSLLAPIDYLRSCHRSSFTKPADDDSAIKVESSIETQNIRSQQSIAYKSNILFLNGLMNNLRRDPQPES